MIPYRFLLPLILLPSLGSAGTIEVTAGGAFETGAAASVLQVWQEQGSPLSAEAGVTELLDEELGGVSCDESLSNAWSAISDDDLRSLRNNWSDIASALDAGGSDGIVGMRVYLADAYADFDPAATTSADLMWHPGDNMVMSAEDPDALFEFVLLYELYSTCDGTLWFDSQTSSSTGASFELDATVAVNAAEDRLGLDTVNAFGLSVPIVSPGAGTDLPNGLRARLDAAVGSLGQTLGLGAQTELVADASMEQAIDQLVAETAGAVTAVSVGDVPLVADSAESFLFTTGLAYTAEAAPVDAAAELTAPGDGWFPGNTYSLPGEVKVGVSEAAIAEALIAALDDQPLAASFSADVNAWFDTLSVTGDLLPSGELSVSIGSGGAFTATIPLVWRDVTGTDGDGDPAMVDDVELEADLSGSLVVGCDGAVSIEIDAAALGGLPTLTVFTWDLGTMSVFFGNHDLESDLEAWLDDAGLEGARSELVAGVGSLDYELGFDAFQPWLGGVVVSFEVGAASALCSPIGGGLQTPLGPGA